MLEFFKFIKKYLKGEKKLMIIAFSAILLSSTLVVLYGYLMGEATKYITEGNTNLAIKMLLIYAGYNIFDILLHSLVGKVKLGKLCNNLMKKISIDTYEKTSALPAVAYEEKSSGELINIITNDSGAVADTFRNFLNTIVYLVGTSVVFIYIAMQSYLLAINILVYIILFYIVSKHFLPKIEEKQKAISEKTDSSIALTTETIRGVREVKSLGIRSKVVSNITVIINAIFKNKSDQLAYEEKYYAGINILSTIYEVGAFLICIYLISTGKMQVAFFVSMTYYIYRFMSFSDYIMNLTSSLQKSKVAIKRIKEITQNETYNDEEFGTNNQIIKKGKINFENVSFKYKNEDKNIFENLNLTIEQNKITALVGPSGQGKSSLFNLLCRFFDVNAGKITVDGIDIKDFTEESLRKNIAVIRQEPFIFNKTIFENFSLVDEKITLEKVRSACKKAQLDDYIMNLPNKYDTLIGEGGVNLSGGQKQRLSIARALIKESKIILLDEATSALDNVNQEKIKEVINTLKKDHTIVIIAHRLTTIDSADTIHIVNNGKIEDSGKHEQLLKTSTIYKNLYKNEG